MSTVPNSFTATGAGPALRVRKGEQFTYSLSGSFSATLVLERSDNGVVWTPILSTTAATSGTRKEEIGASYRWRCSAFTSGTAVTSLADATDTLHEVKSADGLIVFKITEAGIETPLLTGTALSGATVTATGAVTGGSFVRGTDIVLGVTDVVVSSAEMLALNATPKTLVAAPGASKIIVPVMQVFFLDYNSAAYAGIAAGEDLITRYTDGSGQAVGLLEATGFLDQTSDQYRVTFPTTGAGAVLPSFTPVVNAALVLHMSTGEITTGNSPLVVRTFYRVVDLSTLLAV